MTWGVTMLLMDTLSQVGLLDCGDGGILVGVGRSAKEGRPMVASPRGLMNLAGKIMDGVRDPGADIAVWMATLLGKRLLQ